MNPFTIRTGRPGGPRIGDILEDGAGNRALVIDEPGTMDPGMVDRRYIVSVDDPENFTFVGDVRIVGNIANHKEAAMSTPTPRDYGAYDRAIERAVDATQALRQAAADLTAVRKALDPHRQSVPPDSECQRSETDVEVVERLVMERAEWENTSHHVSESAQHWTRSFNKIMAEIGWPHGSGEPCTECILEWIRKHKDADSDSAILLGLRAAAILTADHDCGEEHDAALEVLQAKIEALTADGARSMVGAFSPRAYLYTDGEAGTHREWAEADAQREEATGQDGLPGDIKPLRGVRLANMVESWASAEPVGDLWNAIHHSEIAEWPDPAPASHTASAGPGLTISVPNDAVYQSAKVGDVLRRIYNGTTLRASIVKTEDGVKAVEEVPPLHPGQYVATKEEFDAAFRADTYTETHTVGGLSIDPVRAPKIEIGQVWEDCDGRKGMVTTLPYTVGPDVRFVFMVLTGRIEAPWDVPSSGQRQTAGEYGVIFDGARNIVKANGCKLIAGPGAPWPAK